MNLGVFVSFLIIFASQDLAVAFQCPTLACKESSKAFVVGFSQPKFTQSRAEHTPLWVGGTLDDDFHDKEPLIKRIKTHIKSYHDYKDDAERTVLRRMEPYVKYPFRRVRNYFRGEKQEEVDAFNDIIVSDEVVDNAEASTYLETETMHTTEMTVEKPILAAISSPVIEETRTERAEAITKESMTAVAEPKAEIKFDGVRSGVSAPDVDLSGQWSIVVSDEFKEQYDKYLTLLGQPFLVRSMALSIVGLTNEETEQRDDGKILAIRGENARGVWERTLEASGEENPLKTPIVTVDDERVEAESWWEEKGRVHTSWLRGVRKYGGGDFESKRYLEEGGKVLVCDTTFHPKDATRDKAQVTWRFQRKN